MSQWYHVQAVQDADIPEYKGSQWYSVKLAEHAEVVLWLAKSRPEEGRTVYGHIERTKSGKAWRFKRDQLPEGEQAPVQIGDIFPAPVPEEFDDSVGSQGSSEVEQPHMPQATNEGLNPAPPTTLPDTLDGILSAADIVVAEAYQSIKADDGSEVQILSNAVVELPALLDKLGQFLADAEADVLDAKDNRDYHLDTNVLQYMKANDSSKAEAESYVRISEDYRAKQVKYLQSERISKRLRKKWDSLDRSFEGLRSKLSRTRER